MADVIVRNEPSVTQLSPTAVRWTRQDCDALEKAGVLTYHYELVEGVINKMGQNVPHGILVRLILKWLFGAFGDEFILTQVTIDVRPEDNPTNAPEPDAIVLIRPADELSKTPVPSDIRLCIEASDSTLTYDLNTKANLYARAGISEYWVVSLPTRSLYVHRNPNTVCYMDVKIYEETDSVSPSCAPNVLVCAANLLPKPMGTP